MHCDDAQELFSDYIAGSADRALTVSLDNHLQACAGCRDTVSALRQVWDALDRMPLEEPPPFFHENVMSRIEQETARAAERRRAWWNPGALLRPRSLALAASAALLLLGMEGLHTQRAALDPIGALIRMVRPTPQRGVSIRSSRAEWIPNGTGGGTVVVHLVAQRDSAAIVTGVQCTLTGRRSGGRLGLSAKVTADHETTVSVPVDAQPIGDYVSVSLEPADAGNEDGKTLPVPLMQPLNEGTTPAR